MENGLSVAIVVAIVVVTIVMRKRMSIQKGKSLSLTCSVIAAIVAIVFAFAEVTFVELLCAGFAALATYFYRLGIVRYYVDNGEERPVKSIALNILIPIGTLFGVAAALEWGSWWIGLIIIILLCIKYQTGSGLSKRDDDTDDDNEDDD